MKKDGKRVAVSMNQFAKLTVAQVLEKLVADCGEPTGVTISDKEVAEFKRHLEKHCSSIIKRFKKDEDYAELEGVDVVGFAMNLCQCDDIENEVVQIVSSESDGCVASNELGHIDVSDD